MAYYCCSCCCTDAHSCFCSREAKVAAATIAHEKEKRKPKYIGNLLKQAKMRAVESDRIFDRKLQKEREEQDKVGGEGGRSRKGRVPLPDVGPAVLQTRALR